MDSRLGIGEYERPDDRYSVKLARDGFILTVQLLAPDVAKDLSGEPFTLYLEAGIVGWLPSRLNYSNLPIRETGRAWTKFRRLITGRNAKSHPQLTSLWESLLAWQRRWNLVETEEAGEW